MTSARSTTLGIVIAAILLAGCNESSEERLVKQRAACLALGGTWTYPAWFPCTYKEKR